MGNKKKQTKERKKFDESFERETTEIIILTGGYGSGAGKAGKSELWTVSIQFLAYLDCRVNQLFEVEGRVEWLAEDSERGDWRYNLNNKSIYRLLVRKAMPNLNHPNVLKEGNVRFMVVDVLERDSRQKELEQLLVDYEKPIYLSEEGYTDFELNKEMKCFESELDWVEERALIYLEADEANPHDASQALGIFKKILLDKKEWDRKVRNFAAKELTNLANDWLEEEENPTTEITAEEFSERIVLSELSFQENGNFDAYYNDDDLFWGHVIIVEGTITGDFNSAYIAG